MAKDNPATATVNEVAIVGSSIVLSPTKTGVVLMRRDVADYFGVVIGAGSSDAHRLVERTYTSARKVFDGLYDVTGKDGKAPGTVRFYLPLNLDVKGGGRVIVIPTELTYTKGTGAAAKTRTRTTSMRFPSGAILSQISDWLATKTTTKKPAWFKTPTGHKYIVAAKPAAVTDLNPGDEATPAGG